MITKKEARKVNGFFQTIESAGWFSTELKQHGKGYCCFNMANSEDASFLGISYWDYSEVYSILANNPEDKTCRYRWDFRRVDQLRNVYIWKQ